MFRFVLYIQNINMKIVEFKQKENFLSLTIRYPDDNMSDIENL